MNNYKNRNEQIIILKKIKENIQENRAKTSIFNKELYNRIKEKIENLTTTEVINYHANR